MVRNFKTPLKAAFRLQPGRGLIPSTALGNILLKKRFGFARASSLQNHSISQLLLAGTLALGLGAYGHHLHHVAPAADPANIIITTAAPHVAPVLKETARNVEQSEPAKVFAEARSAVAAAVRPALTVIEPRPQAVTREAELGSGQSFAGFLADAGMGQVDALAAASALGKIYDLRRLQAGQNVDLTFNRLDNHETIEKIAFQPEATREITIARNAAGGFTADSKLLPIVKQRFAAEAQINSSLYDAGAHAGVPYPVMASLMRIYSHVIDFQRDIHPGDGFKVLYDQPMTVKGSPVGEGQIVYAALIINGKEKPVYRVTFSDGTVDYFDEKGISIRRVLMRTPVAAAHITSGFGMRIHPILGYSKMHQGVDFGAPMGAPIFAAGGGTIVEIGFKGGYGRYIRIHHNNTLETVYAHMSRYAANMYRGAHVEQGQVIGYVGMSGRATGPHLHYEVHVNYKPVNPMSVNLPTGRVLEGGLLSQFKQGESKIKKEFANLVVNNSITPASADAPAFGRDSAVSCGLRGGC